MLSKIPKTSVLRRLALALVVVSTAFMTTTARTEITTETTDTTEINITCPDAKILGSRMINGICWDCVLPLGLFGDLIEVGNGNIPRDASDDITCRCKDEGKHVGYRFGSTFSAWLPSYASETVRAPMCSPTLGGVVIGGGDVKTVEGNEIFDVGGERPPAGSGQTATTRYQNHVFEFPLLTVLRFVDKLECLHGGLPTIDLAKVPTEFLPVWNDDELGSLVNGPLCALARKPAMLYACALEGASLTVGNGPIDELFWCNGFSGGTLCPISGTLLDPTDAVSEYTTLAARYLLLQHIMGQLGKSYGDDALCGEETYSFLTPKQQYKHSVIHPVNQSSSEASPVAGKPTTPSGGPSGGGGCCQYYGEHVFKWGLGRTYPGLGEDFVSLIYRYHQCCVTLL